jgi:hypothetical protein
MKASISWSENFELTSAHGDAYFYTSYFLKYYYFGQNNIVLVRLFHILTIDGGYNVQGRGRCSPNPEAAS